MYQHGYIFKNTIWSLNIKLQDDKFNVIYILIYLGWEDPLEKEMATHSIVLNWEIPWTEEPGGLQWGCKSQTRLINKAATTTRHLILLTIWLQLSIVTFTYTPLLTWPLVPPKLRFN